jgi:hypothetical protein
MAQIIIQHMAGRTRTASRIALILLAPIFGFMHHCSGAEFEVTGSISYETFIMDRVQFSSKKDFKVSVGDCRWRIFTKDVAYGDTVEIGFEEGIAYRLNTSVKVGSNVLSALIESEEVPAGDASLISYLWLAYASSCHFSAVTNDWLTPVWIQDDPNLRYEHFKAQAKWVLGGEPPLPSRVEYFNDGIFRVFHPVKNERVSFAARAPYKQGYVNAVYQVVEQTNAVGLIVPTRFVFTRYAIPPQTDTNAVPWVGSGIIGTNQLMVRSVIHVDDARVTPGVTAKIFRPEFQATLTYMDRRFAYSNPAVVNVLNVISNGQWPEVTPQLIKQAKITARATAKPPPQKSQGRKGVVLIALGLISFVFVLLIVLRKPKRT